MIRYLALGDSYTIGTGASSESRNWPSIVARHLGEATEAEVELVNPAVNGYTTQNLIDKELGYLKRFKPDVVSVLIGVNDLVQGRSEADYRKSLVVIYDAVAPVERVACISIPDWADVPAARSFGKPDALRRRTAAFNAIARQESEMRGFTWVDITEVSRSGVGKAGWIAGDDLHPGDVQYAAWAEVIWAAVGEGWASIASG